MDISGYRGIYTPMGFDVNRTPYAGGLPRLQKMPALTRSVFALYADSMIKTFGDFVRERRDSLDLSVREFARKLDDVSPAHISDIENGRRHPSDELLKKMSHVLGVSVDELQKHDLRPPVDELRRMIQRDPAYGVALRKLTQTPMSSDELLKFIEKKSKQRK